jgi:hypothetical protein
VSVAGWILETGAVVCRPCLRGESGRARVSVPPKAIVPSDGAAGALCYNCGKPIAAVCMVCARQPKREVK